MSSRQRMKYIFLRPSDAVRSPTLGSKLGAAAEASSAVTLLSPYLTQEKNQ